MKKVLFVCILIFLSIYYVRYKIDDIRYGGYIDLNKVEYMIDTDIKTYTDEDIKKYSTPFIDDYLERYNANKNSPNVKVLSLAVYSICKDKVQADIPCDTEDWENLQTMATMGVPAALNIFDELDPYFKFYEIKDRNLTSQYLKMLSIEDTPHSYSVMMNLYNQKGMNKNFCETVLEGYEKFGLRFISTYIQFIHLNNITKKKKTISKPYINCLNEKPKEFLKKIDSDEAQFLLGTLYLMDYTKKSADEAFRIFEDVYKNSDDHITKYNAGACLGSMYYKENKEVGSDLIKESMTNGLIVSHGVLPNTNMLSEDKIILNYSPIDFCQIYKQN